MGRLSKQNEIDLLQSQIDIGSSSIDAVVKAAKLIGTEGLWIGLQIDLFLVSGEVDPSDEVIYTQREALNSLFAKGGLIDILKHSFQIPGLSFLGDSAKIPNPISPLAKFISPIGIPLRKFHYEVIDITVKNPFYTGTGIVPVPATLTQKKRIKVYDAVPIQYRIMLTLMLPGLMRLVLKFLGDILDLG